MPRPADNALMSDDPQNNPQTRKRPWFQFSLRTLMMAVTLLAIACGYVASQARIVGIRNAARARIEALGGQYKVGGAIFGDYEEEVPLVRRWLGDEPVNFVLLPESASSSDEQRIREVFPDVVVNR